MAVTYLLDTGPLGLLAHSNLQHRAPIEAWVNQIQASQGVVYVPEVTEYELRRKLNHLVITGRLQPERVERLDELTQHCPYLAVTTLMWKQAAQFWAELRAKGLPAASDSSLDIDMLLAAQAQEVNGTIVTTNTKHFAHFCPVMTWPQP